MLIINLYKIIILYYVNYNFILIRRDCMSKFKIIDTKFVPTLDSSLVIYEHIKTGAKVLYVESDGIEKSFMIQFRTLPKSDNGICHILEHSVLSGSRKYNVKEPFVNLLKGSMNTFLNAMTYPDKTVYPFSTTNEKEFYNLMDVYLDAVLFPNIYKDENILAQEGWHYEFDEDGKLFINGVVYNEMKGVVSNPDSILFREVMRNLYDNVYAVEYGGNPKSIPTLTQKEFLDFHSRYYHPSNSVSFISGKLNIDDTLNKLDEFFGQFDRVEAAEKIIPTKSFAEPKTIHSTYPVTMKEKDKCMIGIGFVQGQAGNLKDNLGLKILSAALFQSSAAPIKNMLLEFGLVQNIYVDFEDDTLQPTMNIGIRGVDEDNVDTVIESIMFELERLSDEGIDRDTIQAVINQWKFNIKEGFDEMEMPKGIVFGILSLSNMDRGVDPAEVLDIEKYLNDVESSIDDNYFESLIKKYFLENNHRVNVILKPDDKIMKNEQEAFEKKMNTMMDSLSEGDIDDIKKSFESLQKRQNTPDSKEEVDKIPKISSKNIDRDIEKVDYEKLDSDIYDLYHVKSEVKGISYVNVVFNQFDLDAQDYKYLSLISSLVGFLGTKNRDYLQLSNDVMMYTGGIYASPVIHRNNDKVSLSMQVSTKFLNNYMDKSLELMMDMIQNTVFDDSSRLYNMLNMVVGNMELSFIERGNSIAAERLVSYFDKGSMIKQSIYGVEFFEFAKDLRDNFEDRKDELIPKLKSVYDKLFKNRSVTVVYQGDALDEYNEKLSEKLKEISCIKNNDSDYVQMDMENESKNEAFIIPSEVNSIAKGYNFKELGYDFRGFMLVGKKIIDTDYLWEEVRVKGGAYGSSCVLNTRGVIYCTSYRDPNVNSTIDVYNNVHNYLDSLEMDEATIDKYIVGTVSDMVRQITNSYRMMYAEKAIFEDFTNEKRQTILNEVLDTKIEDIKSMAPMFKDVMKQDFMSAVGSSKIKKEASDKFDIKSV